MTAPIDDAILSAYVDGELDDARCREVEALMQHDLAVREKVQLLQEVTLMLQEAYRGEPTKH